MANSRAREAALSAAVEDNRARLTSLISRLVADESEAKDVLQDVFSEFIEAYDLGQALESAGAWLIRVARNKVIDRFRRRKHAAEHQLLVQNTERDGQRDGNDWLRATIREEIVTALELLPVEQRDIFIRHELDGQSFEEISAETGVGLNTLLSRKRYAVLALREYLKEIYDELE